jgi:ATP-dependent helicase/nuclease subunit A
MTLRTNRRAPVADQPQRDAAIVERSRNVVIDAGAGTGKTTILVRRLVNMVAPADGTPGFAINRIAAVTFTRRAAGELRQELLKSLAEAPDPSERSQQLRAALAGVDQAYIGTIHSFADRLLRLRPVEARISPSYEVVEDDEPLIQETFVRLLHAVETGALSEGLNDSTVAGMSAAATRTVLDSLRSGLRAESLELEYWTRHGLSGLVAAFIRHRDTPPAALEELSFDEDSFRRAARETLEIITPLRGESHGTQQLVRLARSIERLGDVDDPATILRELSSATRALKRLRMREDFGEDRDAWAALKELRDPTTKRSRPLVDDVLAPAQRCLAGRLAAIFPVVIALYEQV